MYSTEKIDKIFARYPRGSPYVWGDLTALTKTHPEIIPRTMQYIHACRLILEIEYNPTASKKTKRHAIRSIASSLKYMSETGATLRAAGLIDAQDRRMNPVRCYLCHAVDEGICDKCYTKDDWRRWIIVCKKIGNALVEQQLKSKMEVAATRWQENEKRMIQEANFEMRRAQLYNLKSHLGAVKKHNMDKAKRIEELKAKLAQVRAHKVAIKSATQDLGSKLTDLLPRIDPLKSQLKDTQSAISSGRRQLLSDLHLLHFLELHDADPRDLPGHPNIRVQRPPSRSTSGGLAPKPDPKRVNATPPSWHFLHTAVTTNGSLLRTIPQPTTTLVPLITFMYHIAKWWSCALPHPIDPLPVPALYCPSLVNHHPQAGFNPVDPGWHKIPLIVGSNASDYEMKVHQLLIDNARTIMRTVGTFPEDVVDFSEGSWLNAFFFYFLIGYVRALLPPMAHTSATPPPVSPGTPSPMLAQSVVSPSNSSLLEPHAHHQSTHRSRSYSKPGIPFGPYYSPPPPATSKTPSITSLPDSGPSTPEPKVTPPPPEPPTVPIPPPNHHGWRSFLF